MEKLLEEQVNDSFKRLLSDAVRDDMENNTPHYRVMGLEEQVSGPLDIHSPEFLRET
jgi:hypothetical protein